MLIIMKLLKVGGRVQWGSQLLDRADTPCIIVRTDLHSTVGTTFTVQVLLSVIKSHTTEKVEKLLKQQRLLDQLVL